MDPEIDEVKRFSFKTGVLLGAYEFFEEPEQKGSGILSRIFRTNYYLDHGTIKYNDPELGYSDPFCNNLFMGEWKSDQTGEIKTCNWGDYRIPNSGDLDYGAAEFSPNQKYYKYGWGNYPEVWFYRDSIVRKDVHRHWWKE